MKDIVVLALYFTEESSSFSTWEMNDRGVYIVYPKELEKILLGLPEWTSSDLNDIPKTSLSIGTFVSEEICEFSNFIGMSLISVTWTPSALVIKVSSPSSPFSLDELILFLSTERRTYFMILSFSYFFLLTAARFTNIGTGTGCFFFH